MKKIHKGFAIFYVIWAVLNITVMIMAYSGLFGPSDKTMTEFWPFTVGELNYYDFYELSVYLIFPLLIYIVYREGKSRMFWIPYIAWSLINIILMVMAISDVFGDSDRTVKQFWPFSVGGLKYFDLLELVVYLVIPLSIYYIYRIAHGKTTVPISE